MAFREYDTLRTIPSVAEPATLGAIRAAALAAQRERELGMADEGYLGRATQLAATVTDLAEWTRTALAVAEALRGTVAGVSRSPASDEDLERDTLIRRSRAAWTTALREVAERDELAGYTWLNFMCGSIEARDVPTDAIFAAASTFADARLGRFKRATCRGLDGPKLQTLFDEDARFAEISYLLGLVMVGQRQVDQAEPLFQRAYDWHPRWPSLTVSMANAAMVAEEFDRAAGLYDETLSIRPGAVDALLGKARALTYEGRHEDAITTTDRLLTTRWYLGDARYWRALNEADLERYDEAWQDIEESAKLLINADVPKLAGIIAYRRKRLDVSRAKFEESLGRAGNDCETRFFYGTVLAELRDWEPSARALTETVQCLDRAQAAIEQEIAQIRGSRESAERQARKIARREAQITAARRTRLTSWFDLAVDYFSLSRAAEARQYAEKVADDEQFGSRAREILSRLR